MKCMTWHKLNLLKELFLTQIWYIEIKSEIPSITLKEQSKNIIVYIIILSRKNCTWFVSSIFIYIFLILTIKKMYRLLYYKW
jgi:hypothetical protein